MYYYVYDERALAKDSQRALTKIETQINNLGLSGERGQVSALRTVEDLVKDAARKNYRPIVAVGEDATFNAALNALAELRSQIPLGYIPLVPKQPMSELLGVDANSAVVSLSRRIIKTVPVALAGGAYFLSFVRCVLPDAPATKWWERLLKKNERTFSAEFTLDDALKASVSAREVTVYFSPGSERLRVEAQGIAQHDKKNRQDLSVVWAKKIHLQGEPQLACLIDGRPVTRTPIDISVSQVHVKIIVGRARSFE